MVAIIGYGAMAQALLEGFLQKRVEVCIVGRDKTKREALAKRHNIQSFPLENFDITSKEILLAIKPYALEEVANKLQGKAKGLYSILAGTPIQKLRTIKAEAYIRAMPNIAALKGASTTALTGDEALKSRALELFSAVGETIWLQSEKELDIATAIAGSGPAFLALIAEAMMDGGVMAGLKRQDAQRLTQGLFLSFAALSDEHPALIKDQVMSPAGTTAAGIQALERQGVRSAFIEAVMEAFKKTLR